MKDKDYNNILEFSHLGGVFLPFNQKAKDLVDSTLKGEILAFIEVTERDVKFHRAYFGLLSFIYDYLPGNFKSKIAKSNFYIVVKHLKKDYDVKFTFADGTQFIEYDSISFGKMTQKTFEVYVRDQLPFIYENIIGAFYSGEKYDAIIDTIEKEFEKFLINL